MTTEGPAFSTGEWWAYRYPFRHWRASQRCQTRRLTDGSRRLSGQFWNPARAIERVSTGSLRATRITTRGSSPSMLIWPVFSCRCSRRAGIDSIHTFLSIPNTGRIDAALHSSPQGSHTGWIHNDLCSGWFDEASTASEGPVFANRSACDYFTGQIKNASASPKEYVRVATVIYYLCNEGWTAGDGGETGLYAAKVDREHTTIELVPPADNTLLLFECSPHSYHRFLANPGRRRNASSSASASVDLHCPDPDASAGSRYDVFPHPWCWRAPRPNAVRGLGARS